MPLEIPFRLLSLYIQIFQLLISIMRLKIPSGVLCPYVQLNQDINLLMCLENPEASLGKQLRCSWKGC